jgi:hypothetical protein
MSNVEGSLNAQMTKVLREMFSHSDRMSRRSCAKRVISSSLGISSFVIDFRLSFSTHYLLFVARRYRVVTICAPGSGQRDCISE